MVKTQPIGNVAFPQSAAIWDIVCPALSLTSTSILLFTCGGSETAV